MEGWRISLFVSLLLVFTPEVFADDVRPGLWTLNLTMTVPGAESEFGPFTKTQCFTEQDARNPGKLFSEMGGECAYRDKRYQGNRFTFSVECSGAVPMQGGGEVSFSADSFEGSLEIQAKVSELGQVKTKSRVKGTRVGDCPNQK